MRYSGVFFVIVCAISFAGFAAADTFTIPTPDSQSRGWYDANDFHDPTVDSYFVGNAGALPGQTVRNFFVFDFSIIPRDQIITSAVLLLYNPPGGFYTTKPSGTESYVIFSIDTVTVAALRAGGTQPGAYADLGSGTPYSLPIALSFADDAADVAIPLNLDFVAYAEAQKGALIALGGVLTTVDPGQPDYAFALSGTNSGVALSRSRLVITTVPEPTTAILMVFAVGICAMVWKLSRPTRPASSTSTPNQAMQRTAGRSAFPLPMIPPFNQQPNAPSPAVAHLVSR